MKGKEKGKTDMLIGIQSSKGEIRKHSELINTKKERKTTEWERLEFS